MQDDASMAIQAAQNGRAVFCKFLSANDTGSTGGHQAGIYIAKPAFSILFSEPGIRGENKEKRVTIKWQNDFETDTRFIYYGKKTRNEYRITNFGRNFPFLRPEYTGALLILVQYDEDHYGGYVLNTEEAINSFLDTFGISPTETNQLIQIDSIQLERQEKTAIDQFISRLAVEFPSTEEMSTAAREIQDIVYDHQEYIRSHPDEKIIAWMETEYRLFRAIESDRYGEQISQGFATMEDFITVANRVLNRRKSRAGKGLEHHLAAIFDGNGLQYQAQAVTEGNKTLDFLFPSESAYHDANFPVDQLISLAAKTTCKDRWRQILNEADRLRGKTKFLCTLQQGISVAQMDEMQAERVILVVPKPYIAAYPKERRERIWTLHQFIGYVREREA